MREILLQHKPTLLVEIYQGLNSNEDPDGTVNMLIDMGYKAYVFDRYPGKNSAFHFT